MPVLTKANALNIQNTVSVPVSAITSPMMIGEKIPPIIPAQTRRPETCGAAFSAGDNHEKTLGNASAIAPPANA